MRGSISYEDAVYLSFDDRDMINKIIKDNLETTKESGLPFFWDVLQTSVVSLALTTLLIKLVN